MSLPDLQPIAEGTVTTPEGVRIERQAGVVTLTLDCLADMNRLTPEVLARLLAVADSLRDDPNASVLVITGAGNDVFSAGILNPALRAGYSKDDVVRLVRFANRVFDAIEALPQIVIAAINGSVVAGAVELCLACDIRYAAEHATLCMPEALWGGFPGAGGPARLAGLVGRARALEMICTGRTLDAAELLRIDLVQQVFAADAFLESVATVARRIGDAAPLAVKGAKRIVNTRLEPGVQAARVLSESLRHALEWSRDVDEGIAAHRESRRAVFTGR